MRRFLPILLLAWGGCFTEVGNAEDDNLVRAEFRIDYGLGASALAKPGLGTMASENMLIDLFYVRVREAEFHNQDGSEMHLWRGESAGVFVDFTLQDTAAKLPQVSIAKQSINNFKLEIDLFAATPIDPDTIAFHFFDNRAYIKGEYAYGASNSRFIFALPAGVLHLIYAKETMDAWMRGNVYDCQFIFNGRKWLAGSRLDTATAYPDRNREPLVLLDSQHNPQLYNALVEKFYTSFNTADVFSRSVRD